MNGDNQLQLSLRNKWLQFKNSGKLSIILKKKSKEYTPNLTKKYEKTSTCNQLDLESLGPCKAGTASFFIIGFLGVFNL
jgi:hypothetical protein